MVKTTLADIVAVEVQALHDLCVPETLVMYASSYGITIDCRMNIKKGSMQVIYHFSDAVLSRFGDNGISFFEHTPALQIYSAESTICCQIQQLSETLLNTSLQGLQRQIFTEAIALQVLLAAYPKSEQSNDLPCYQCKFLNNPTEKQKILQARVLTLIHISQPMSIPQLARAVHINECYLKKGFKEMFGSSIFDFVQQERIKKAKLMLQQHIAIQHIAIELGYANTANFTNAFKKLTGYAPSEWLRLQTVS